MALAIPVADATREFLTQPRQLLIGGEWVDAADGETFDSIDPGTGEVLATVAHGKAEDVDRAVRAARAALDGPWSKLTPSERGRAIHRLGDLIAENLEELAEIDSLDNGKAKAVAAAADVPARGRPVLVHGGLGDEASAVDRDAFAAVHPGRRVSRVHESRSRSASSGRSSPGTSRCRWRHGRSRPALATGNTSSSSRPSRRRSARCAWVCSLEAGMPDGVLNVLTGPGDAGGALAEHPASTRSRSPAAPRSG